MLNRRSLIASAVLPLLVACASPGLAPVAPTAARTVQPNDWDALGMEQLSRLVSSSWATHPDIAVAVATARQARAVASQQSATRQPLLEFAGSTENGHNLPYSSTVPSTASLSLNWDADLFGATEATATAAAKRAQGQQLLLSAAKSTLACQLVSAAIAVTVESQRVKWSADYVALAKERQAYVALRMGAGLASLVELDSAKGAVAQARRLEKRVAGEYQEALLGLSRLSGQSAEALEPLVQRWAERGVPYFDATRPIDSTWLAQRPDMVAAEAELDAAGADIQGAEKARFPKLNLGAVFTVSALTFSGLGTATGVAALTRALQWDFLDGGRTAAQLESAHAGEELARARYRQKSVAVVQEATTALVRYRLAQDEVEAGQAGMRTADEAQKLAQESRDLGTADIGVVLDARKGVLDAQALALESAELMASTMGRVLQASGGPLPGLHLEFKPLR